jgi:hypothetical protein
VSALAQDRDAPGAEALWGLGLARLTASIGARPLESNQKRAPRPPGATRRPGLVTTFCEMRCGRREL